MVLLYSIFISLASVKANYTVRVKKLNSWNHLSFARYILQWNDRNQQRIYVTNDVGYLPRFTKAEISRHTGRSPHCDSGPVVPAAVQWWVLHCPEWVEPVHHPCQSWSSQGADSSPVYCQASDPSWASESLRLVLPETISHTHIQNIKQKYRKELSKYT